jgi:hypothetical protein
MNKNLLLLLAAFGTAGYFFYKKKQVTTAATSVRFNLKQIKLSGTNIILKLGVLNASSQSATLKSIVGDLVLSGNTIATVKTFNPVSIKPAAETDIELTLVPTGVGIVTTIANLVTGKKIKGFTFTGKANVNNMLIPISIIA